MAQSGTKKKTNTKGKTAAKGSSKSKKPEPKPKNTLRSYKLAGAASGVLALILAVGMFDEEGIITGALCHLLKGLFGYGFLLCVPVLVLLCIMWGFCSEKPKTYRSISALLTPLFAGGLCDLMFGKIAAGNAEGFVGLIKMLYDGGKLMRCGGLFGGILSYGFEAAFSFYGAVIILTVLFVIFLLGALNITPAKLIEGIKNMSLEEEYEEEYEEEPKSRRQAEKRREEATVSARRESKRRMIDIPLDDDEPEEEKPEKHISLEHILGKRVKSAEPEDEIPVIIETLPEFESEPVTVSDMGFSEAAEISVPPKKLSEADIAAETALVASEIENSDDKGEYEKPPIYLLKKGHATASNAESELKTNLERLESAIKSFGVSGRIVDMTHGPTVTRYDVELEQGVKLTRLTNLAGDIALALGVVSVRIAPIPNKISTVGIEVPNKLVSTVYLRDIIDSKKFTDSKAELSFAIGKDIGGEAVVGNISKLPHLLIAGTTGSGKSVCMNSLIISLLYKSTPDDVKLIMIDPKMVELGVYNEIPQLYIPVVTDPKKAAGALQWAVTEMLKRYRLFSEVGVRSLSAYNEHIMAEGQKKLPNVVVVIDELADLMLVASKEVEECICRVAQMGRAAGMHLVIATQRPSADVITGLMKANIPSRIAFAVSSAMESRIILDNSGAEKLVGMGDMLYAPLGCGKPLRVQGAFVSDEERDAIVHFIKEQTRSDYSEDIMAQIEKAAAEKGSSGKSSDSSDTDELKSEFDELLPQAVDVVFDTKQASVSMLQRRLKLGYSRAARIIDQMEELGVVGPFEGSKPRQLLITKDQWMQMQTTYGTAPTESFRTQLEFSDDIETD